MVAVILCGLICGAIYYILTETRAIEEKMKMQYIQCKLSNVETNLSLVEYLLRNADRR